MSLTTLTLTLALALTLTLTLTLTTLTLTLMLTRCMSLTGTQLITETNKTFTFGPDATSCAAGEQVACVNTRDQLHDGGHGDYFPKVRVRVRVRVS